MASGKCPACGNLVRHLKVNAVPIREGGVDKFHGITLACGSCNTVLGADINPIRLKEDILSKLGK